MSSSRRRKPSKVDKHEPVQPLASFMKAKARELCRVCQLPQEVRDQLGPPAARRGFTRHDQVEWLNSAVLHAPPPITLEQLNAHFNGRHDQDGV